MSRTFHRFLLRRDAVLSWLAATAGFPVSVICAPAGNGKTTVGRDYVARSDGRAAYVSVLPGTSLAEVDEAIAAAGDVGEVVLDDLDVLPADDVRRFVQRLERGVEKRRFILIGSSARRLGVEALVARGFAVSLPATALAFDAEQTAKLASQAGVAHDDQDVIQLLHDTDGWPIAVDWIVREAASTSRSLRGAFEAWRGMHGHLLVTFVESECANDPEAQARFRAFFANVEGAGPRELAELEALGFPVVRTRSGLRPYRIIAALAAPEADDLPYAVRPPAYLTMNVLGRFGCKIDGRSIAFQRRRDQNVFTYVALAPDCRATRMQLLEAFWPGTVRTVAAQHLRTTISRIRRALAEAVGADCVERYFQSTGDICIDPSFLVLDARRFVEHVEHGRIEDARGASAVAKHHYAAAERLYRGRLLASEPVEPCFHKSLEQLEAAYSEALSRLVNISVTRNEVADAKDYGARLLARAADTEERRSAMRLLVNEMVLA